MQSHIPGFRGQGVMQIFVRTMEGDTITLQANPDDPVEKFKASIERSEGGQPLIMFLERCSLGVQKRPLRGQRRSIVADGPCVFSGQQ